MSSNGDAPIDNMSAYGTMRAVFDDHLPGESLRDEHSYLTTEVLETARLLRGSGISARVINAAIFKADIDARKLAESQERPMPENYDD